MKYKWLSVFLFAEDGAVTVDFIALTSAVVVLGTSVVLVVASGLGVGSNGIDDKIVYTVEQAAVIGEQIVNGK